jgi:DNA mismatch repair protein MutS
MPPKKSNAKSSNTPFDNPNSTTKLYFSLYEKYVGIYGKNIVILLQVGSFFELYGVKTPDGQIHLSNIEEIGQIGQLSIAEQSANYTSNTLKGKIVMGGFQVHRLDIYVERFIEESKTVIVYTQRQNGSTITRELYQILSPGSFIPYNTDSTISGLSNHTMCIWFDSYVPLGQIYLNIVYGLATINIFTGETTIFEHDIPFLLNPTTFDELEQYLSIINPSELIIISKFDEKQTQTFLNYSGIKTRNIHTVYLNSASQNSTIKEQTLLCMKQTYISHILTTFFGEECYSKCREFTTYTIATQAFCYLMHFIQNHNPDLVRKISYPIFHNLSSKIGLANHTLKQLNIISDGTEDSKTCGRLSSVLTLLNKCCTSIGKRRFRSLLTNPTFDEEWLNREYEITERFLNMDKLAGSTITIDIFRKLLVKIRDIEKMSRQLIIKKIYPSSIFQLYSSICILKDIYMTVDIESDIQQYLSNETDGVLSENITEILEYLDSTLIISNCSSIDTMIHFEKNIFREGLFEKVDHLSREYTETTKLFERIHEFFNSVMQKNTVETDDTEYVRIHTTEKSGSFLHITKKRELVLKQNLEKVAILSNSEKTLSIAPDFMIPLKDIRFVKATSSNDAIEFPQLTQLTGRMNSLKERLSDEIVKSYIIFLEEFERKYYTTIQSFGKYIGNVDLLQNKAYIAKTYHYCKPVIDITPNSKSYVNIKGLRHPLIEQLQQNETYITNDIVIGDNNQDGMLIYGTNAVGKTSLIRALGISIIQAQAGLYVPCESFIYKPYTAIFSRILGNDNIFKGLSTFAVEMSELRIILKCADENSLILGDELCSGTETESALSIFTAGLMELHDKKSSFIFATHFHEICKYDEIENLTRLHMKHMSVHYDATIDALVYDRLLKSGSGNRMYGLEVCKSLYLRQDFLEKAYEIRNKYHPVGELSFGSSHFNKNKVVGICELCGLERGEEIHHLSPQRKADKSGYIQTETGIFHKNHPANLASLCSKCHDKIHFEKKIIKKTKTTDGFIFS